ncbi:uncharacterized protein LOC135927449 isoform X2 [Gordionus sp. m RMFG-2023]|uniref:uncharacterized protein LOC135927449 isoform X2 n=1 Tax=Gordionus sp. m RMFG-2023 TaxID=3053472 RepID=UPI0031FE0202
MRMISIRVLVLISAMIGCLPSIQAGFPAFDFGVFFGMFGPLPNSTDLVLLIEDTYTSSLEYDCALSMILSATFFRDFNNPLGKNGSTIGIVTYGKSYVITLKMRQAITYAQIISVLSPTAIYNPRVHSVNVAGALALANQMLKKGGTNTKKKVLIFISQKSSVDPGPIAALMKSNLSLC